MFTQICFSFSCSVRACVILFSLFPCPCYPPQLFNNNENKACGGPADRVCWSLPYGFPGRSHLRVTLTTTGITPHISKQVQPVHGRWKGGALLLFCPRNTNVNPHCRLLFFLSSYSHQDMRRGQSVCECSVRCNAMLFLSLSYGSFYFSSPCSALRSPSLGLWTLPCDVPCFPFHTHTPVIPITKNPSLTLRRSSYRSTWTEPTKLASLLAPCPLLF